MTQESGKTFEWPRDAVRVVAESLADWDDLPGATSSGYLGQAEDLLARLLPFVRGEGKQ